MFRNRRAALAKIGCQCTSVRGTGPKAVQDRAPRGVSDRPKHVATGLSAMHATCNLLVTYHETQQSVKRFLAILHDPTLKAVAEQLGQMRRWHYGNGYDHCFRDPAMKRTHRLWSVARGGAGNRQRTSRQRTSPGRAHRPRGTPILASQAFQKFSPLSLNGLPPTISDSNPPPCYTSTGRTSLCRASRTTIPSPPPSRHPLPPPAKEFTKRTQISFQLTAIKPLTSP